MKTQFIHFQIVAGNRLRSALAWLLACCFCALPLLPRPAGAQAKAPVFIGLDGEFGHASSTSAEAIKQGTLIALEEINQRGGVLGGRPLQLVERANNTVPARSMANIREFAAMSDLVAVYCGRFSPTVLESLPLIHELGLPLLDPWAAADAIVDNGRSPNYVFRLSLRDSWAAPAMLDHLARKKVKRVGLMMLNTSWGRSTKKAAEDHVARKQGIELVDTQWINWDDKEESMLLKYKSLRQKGAQAVLLTANAEEAAVLARVMLQLPAAERMPVASHWGVAGGDLPKLAGPDFFKLEFAVVQTYSFAGAKRPTAARVVQAHQRMFGSQSARAIPSPVGVAHAYDLTHLLALAINKAGSTDRARIRDALENLGPYDGLMRRYAKPFTPQRHEALEFKDVFMAHYAERDGVLERAGTR